MNIETVLQKYTLILIDASCVLCHGFAHFVIRHDKKMNCWFGGIQDEDLHALLSQRGFSYSSTALDSVLVVTKRGILDQSSAVLHVLGQLPWYRQWIRIGWIVPKILRDGMYKWVARNRIGWFGEKENCDLMQSREINHRLIEV